ncbi:hypothetical protein AWW66_19610 [Micromonospora rosaria]|uniref:Uncharacterized protein n=1 Tax=Micromonospora rosaria TaxID=47874 RepID=A0A136PQ43_9ACTN|nr:DUF6578 domain-containing protein [Micromonospora rosaria]KXK60326.1 hypothetical protein AWW66_19610 [Micromonospora rosaria]
MAIKVWVDDWQMRCCGEPFAVGDRVSWRLRDLDPEWLGLVLGSNLARGVDKAEEHHGGVGEEVLLPVVGIVASIHAVHCRYAPLHGKPSTDLFPVPGSGTMTSVRFADGRDPDRGDLTFAGYVVQLTGE